MTDWLIQGIKKWQIVSAYFIIVMLRKRAHPETDNTNHKHKSYLITFFYINPCQIAHTFNKEQSLLYLLKSVLCPLMQNPTAFLC